MPDQPTTAEPPQPPRKRYHDLDALRAFAMLAGIFLHGLLSFIYIPIWPAQDIYQYPWLNYVLDALHGFRMPLFFLISGFFTTMLWQRRGLKALLAHRAKRILLPLVVFTIVFWPMVMGVGWWGSVKKKQVAEAGVDRPAEASIWTAAQEGDLDAIKQHLDNGVDINGKDEMVASPLHWAAVYGQTEAMQLLIDRGADLDSKDGSGSTPLIWASFFGQPEAVKVLIDAGVTINQTNNRNETALDTVKAPWSEELKGITSFFAGMMSLKLDLDSVRDARPVIAELLRENGGIPAAKLEQPASNTAFKILGGIIIGGAMVPIFHHLWFLYYLILLVIGFAVVALIVERFKLKPLPEKMLTAPGIWLWIVPLTLLPQLGNGIFPMVMGFPTFGPDTATGIIPWPPKLFYYAVFFGLGAACYGRTAFEQRIGKLWHVQLIIAVPVFLLALHWMELRDAAWNAGFDTNRDAVISNHVLHSIATVFYTWLLIFAMIGFFRRHFPGESKRIRYISDSSYWLYLAHLPLIMALQVIVSDWPVNGLVKCAGVCLVTTAILLISYEYMIRYTFIGTMLNGKRTRESVEPLSPVPPVLPDTATEVK
jgi:peptidoglycan/LPS O-acetylase OafA/YrhL